jgi:hypothetical protein
MVAALVVFIALRPMIPLPLASWRMMAEINAERFAAQVAQCEKYYGHLGASVWVWRTNILNGVYGLSNFAHGGWRVFAMVYNSALWLVFTAGLLRYNWRLVAVVGYLIAISGVTHGQGDRVMMVAVPMVIYLVGKNGKTGQTD